MDKALLGLFEHADTLIDAADNLKKSGYGITIFSPVPLGHELEPALGERKNHVRYFAFFGGVWGFFFGTIFALGTAALYVLPRSGRPLFPVTPTLLIAYETTILSGVIFTLIGFLLFTKLPSFWKPKIYDPQVNVDSFGLLVEELREDRFEEVERILREFGAFDVKTVEKK